MAQYYANKLAASGAFEHSERSFLGKCGENLAMNSGEARDGKDAVDRWYNEVEDYDFSTHQSKNGKAVGHFTQVVWKGNGIIFRLIVQILLHTNLYDSST